MHVSANYTQSYFNEYIKGIYSLQTSPLNTALVVVKICYILQTSYYGANQLCDYVCMYLTIQLATGCNIYWQGGVLTSISLWTSLCTMRMLQWYHCNLATSLSQPHEVVAICCSMEVSIWTLRLLDDYARLIYVMLYIVVSSEAEVILLE